jgi:hypothetical protein
LKGSKLGGPWKVPSLVAHGRFQAWWPLEGKGKKAFHLFSLSPPNKFLFKPFFSIDLKVYFIMVLNRYFMPFFPFP